MVPFPNSKNVSSGTQDNPAIVLHSGVIKQRVAQLSIKAQNVLPLIRAGTTSSMPSSSTRAIFFIFFLFSPITTPVNLESCLTPATFPVYF